MKLLLPILLLSFALPTASVLAQSSPTATPSPNRLQKIDSAGQTLIAGTGMERKRAESYLTTTYIKGDQEAKNAIAALIVSLLSAPVAEHELWNAVQSPRTTACIIAGHAEIDAAVPALIKLLKPIPGQNAAHNLEGLPTENEDGHELGFAALALIDIGKPAIPALRAEQRQSTDPVIQSLIKTVLTNIDKEEPFKKQKRQRYF